MPVADGIRRGHAIYVDADDVGGALHRARRTAPRVRGAAADRLRARRSGRWLLSIRPAAARFDAGERDLLEALATQSAVAVARAQLYEREHAVAQTLQASLLPRALPVIPGLDLAARLHGGTPGLDVGGDFYDAFALARRRAGGSRSATCAARASTPRR